MADGTGAALNEILGKLLQWNLMSSKTYNALETKNPMGIYFIKDTHQIFRGEELYTGAVEVVDALPTVGVVGKLYVVSSTGAASIYNGTGWIAISGGGSGSGNVSDTVSPDDTESPVSGSAVADYVKANAVSDAVWDAATKTLKVTKNDTETTYTIKEFATELTYDGTTGKLTLKAVDGTELSTINIPVDNFVESGTFNTETAEIELTLKNGDVVKIPAQDIFTEYTGEATSTATTTVADGKIKTDVKVSSDTKNLLKVVADETAEDGTVTKQGGLMLSSDDINAMNKVAAGKENEIIVADAEGNASASGVKAGGAALAETTDDKTLATEKAVETALADKVDTTNIITADDELNVETPSAEKVISEAALIKALSWHIYEDEAEEPSTPAVVNGGTI